MVNKEEFSGGFLKEPPIDCFKTYTQKNNTNINSNHFSNHKTNVYEIERF